MKAINLELLEEPECDQFYKLSGDVHRALGDLDEEAQLHSKALAANGELAGIVDFTSHWFVEDIQIRQRGHVEDLQYMLDVLLARTRSAIADLVGTPDMCVSAA